MRSAPGGLLVAALLCAACAAPVGASGTDIVVGSKKFTESVILGEVATLLAGSVGAQAVHRDQLGGTQVLFKALTGGDVDVYPEYTGTIGQEILAGQGATTTARMRAALADLGVRMSEPLGFNNTYAIGMLRETAGEHGIATISALVRHPELRLGFTNEFMDRADGWPGLQARYRLAHEDVQGLDHDLAYRGLAAGSIAATDLYSTDAEIRYYDLHVLRDDLQYFPEYQAVWLYRDDLEARAPAVVAALRRLVGAIAESLMVGMNARAKLDRVPEPAVAADFLRETLGISVEVRTVTWVDRLVERTREHLSLVGISLGAAILLAIPLGVLAARRERFGQVILALVGGIQTIPSLALLVFMIPLLGIGSAPAISALFLYSLLPIVRNTYAGLHDIPAPIRESAAALGLPGGARLRLVELPMAARAILAGIKTSAVINVGTATLGALIGAGGYGQPILTGIRLDDTGLILQGALPAAGLAFAMQGVFELLERIIVSRGLRFSSAD